MADTTIAVSPLRRRMIDDMTLRNLSPATQRSYLHAITKFSRYFCRPPLTHTGAGGAFRRNARGKGGSHRRKRQPGVTDHRERSAGRPRITCSGSMSMRINRPEIRGPPLSWKS